ncbi:MAG: tRNA G10 N-methylase Trm11 [Bacteriovoracaceae bacterium]|jgi:tRNA G10  N-methylase Trm11
MKRNLKIFIKVVAFSFFLLSCKEESKGSFKLNRDFRFNPTSSSFTVKEGSYISELSIEKSKGATLRIYLDKGFKEIKFSIPKIEIKDKNNYEINVKGVELGQDFDAFAKISTNINYSAKRFEFDNCQIEKSIKIGVSKITYKTKLKTKITTVKFLIENGKVLLGTYEGISFKDSKEIMETGRCL